MAAVPIDGKGRVDGKHVSFKGRLIPVSGGMFYLDHGHGRSRRRIACGTDPEAVRRALKTQSHVIELRREGMEVADAPELEARGEKTLGDVVREYRAAPPIGLRAKSVGKYVHDLEQFTTWASRSKITRLAQVGREVMLEFMSWLKRGEQLEMKTVVNRGVIVTKILRDFGASIQMKRGEWPRVTEEQPEIYTPAMLAPFFAAIGRDDFILFQTYLLRGFREQELGFLDWEDFNPVSGTLSVSKKAHFNFDPKNYSERTIEIHADLVALLLEHKTRRPRGTRLIFGTRDGLWRGR
jgi:integrase